MSIYHLHARLVEGTLGAFSRDETRAPTSDSWVEALTLAEELRDSGFTVWIYEHGPPHPFPTASDLRVVQCLAPVRVRAR